MFANLDESQLQGAIEALLFVTDEPVNIITLSEMLEVEPAMVQEALAQLAERLNAPESGIVLEEVAGGWRLYTKGCYHELLEKYVLSWDTRKLSQAALETLAIVAYGQPITRLGISSIRGVNSDSALNTLIEKGLARESGQADAPGYPMTYSTTKTFLETFGLNDTDDLPALESFAPDEKTAAIIREGLSAHARFAVRDEDSLFDWEASDAEAIKPQESRTQLDGESFEDAVRRAMGDAISNALAESAGVVEKIDFSQLDFEE